MHRETKHPVDQIVIQGARTHNLQNVDLSIPRNRLTVITGVSGSGKSSLAFDTLLAEGQRQYIDSLSVHARQFFDQMERPDVDRIEGLQPAIAIDQTPGRQGPRSTVGTLTEIYDYLRLLYARAGDMACAKCGAEITQQSPDEIRQAVQSLPDETRVMILAPLVRGKKGRHEDQMERARKAGFVRIRIDGLTFALDDAPEVSARKPHDIEAVIDRVVLREGIDSRLAESIRLAIKHGEGVVQTVYQTPEDKTSSSGVSPKENGATYNASNGWREKLFNTRYACPECKTGVAEVEPRSFSFNSPYGACPACHGMGVEEGFDPVLVLPDRSLSLREGAVAPWRDLSATGQEKRLTLLDPFLESLGITDSTPLVDWPEDAIQALLTGKDDFSGLLIFLEEERASTKKSASRDRLDAYRESITCPDCRGARLRAEALACHIGGKGIHEVSRLSVREAREFLSSAPFNEDLAPVATPLVDEITRRLAFLDQSGAEYLTLDRQADTLSGGELQRVRLATGIGSGLVGVMYLLDEPSVGLHPRDTERLIESLRNLQRQGNTVVVVEHDEAVMRAADWIVDIGPGAGDHGGRVVAEGSCEQIACRSESVTGAYLAGRKSIAMPARRRRIVKKRSLQLEGATLNNLKEVSVAFPLGALVCVSGVSGSGKSSLVVDTLAPAVRRKLHGATVKPGPYSRLRGLNQIDRCVQVDQSPLGRSPRSNAATYTGIFDEVRKVFAKTKLARQRGYRSGRFSFNVKGGRCEECQGQGVRKIEMNFLSDLYVTCETCRGARFNRQTLTVKYRGKTIADVLAMSVDEAIAFFSEHPAMHRMIHALQEVGLGYLPLGQPSTTLSGGEAQRVKLAAELGASASGHTLYLLDEPTMGLHADDVKQLLEVLQKLVDAGNTVLVIEHHLDIMRSTDWLIDLGPEGGEAGGYLVAAGTPEQVAQCEESQTGRWL